MTQLISSIIPTHETVPLIPESHAFDTSTPSACKRFHAWCLLSHERHSQEFDLLLARHHQLFAAIDAGVIDESHAQWQHVCSRIGVVWHLRNSFSLYIETEYDEAEEFKLTPLSSILWNRHQRELEAAKAPLPSRPTTPAGA